MEEVLFLANICSKVYLVHRREEFRCRKDKLEEVKNTSNIEILTSYNLESAEGDGEKLELLRFIRGVSNCKKEDIESEERKKDNNEGEENNEKNNSKEETNSKDNNSKEEKIELKVDGLFFGIGHTPNTQFLEENFKNILGEDKYIKVDEKCQTEVEGIFACGDVFDKTYRQAVTAASSGCIAGLSAEEYLRKKKI